MLIVFQAKSQRELRNEIGYLYSFEQYLDKMPSPIELLPPQNIFEKTLVVESIFGKIKSLWNFMKIFQPF